MTERMITAIEHPLIDAIGHPTGRKIESRAPYAIDVDRIIEAAARTGTMLEINSAPDRRDLDDVHARAAAAAGVRIIIDSDAHGPNTLIHTRWGVATARRAWLTKADVANTLPWEQFAELCASAPAERRRARRGRAVGGAGAPSPRALRPHPDRPNVGLRSPRKRPGTARSVALVAGRAGAAAARRARRRRPRRGGRARWPAARASA